MSTENTTDQEAVDKVAEQAVEEATDNAVELTPEQSNAVNFMANKFLNNVRLSEALSVVTLNQLLQLVQQQVVSQATAEVEQMTDEQLSEILAEAKEFNETLT
tara:strand:- start:89 stop:397 length:309 start_codon:yes stop_codon:yes gene_type:complete